MREQRRRGQAAISTAKPRTTDLMNRERAYYALMGITLEGPAVVKLRPIRRPAELLSGLPRFSGVTLNGRKKNEASFPAWRRRRCRGPRPSTSLSIEPIGLHFFFLLGQCWALRLLPNIEIHFSFFSLII